MKNEVIIGAKCTLTDKESGQNFTVSTDNFGDFWFRGLEDDRTFSLEIEKGDKVKLFDNITTKARTMIENVLLEPTPNLDTKGLSLYTPLLKKRIYKIIQNQ